MKFSKIDLIAKKRSYIVMAAILFGLYTLMCCVIYPLCITMSEDILYDATYIPELLEYLYKILELVAVSSSLALLTFCIFAYTLRHSFGGVLVLFGATVYKYIMNMLADWAMSGSIPMEWIWDVIDSVFYVVLEAVLLFAVILAIVLISRKRRGDSGGYLPVKEGEYPFSNVLDLRNYYLRSAFACAVIVFASKLFGRLSNDVFSVINYGFPEQGVTWLIMSLAYIFETASGVLCYAVIALIISRILNSALKKSDIDV